MISSIRMTGDSRLSGPGAPTPSLGMGGGLSSPAMGKRKRRREKLVAPTSDYTDREGNVLTLRGSLSAASRREYARVAGGSPLSREDAWQRSTEFLFERLAVRWIVAGLPIERQRELLGRYRMASQEERRWIRDVLREHVAEHFPELEPS
jgi:hypothetical protein